MRRFGIKIGHVKKFLLSKNFSVYDNTSCNKPAKNESYCTACIIRFKLKLININGAEKFNDNWNKKLMMNQYDNFFMQKAIHEAENAFSRGDVPVLSLIHI